MTDMALVYPAGKEVTNFDTLGAVDEKVFTVPPGKRWLLLFGRAQRDVNATFDASMRDTSNNIIGALCLQVGAGVTTVHLPRDNEWPRIPLLRSGFDIIFNWGAAQTTPEVALVVLEMDE